MARLFTRASSEDITLALGALNFGFGPGTVAFLIRPNSMGSQGTLFSAGSSTIGFSLAVLSSALLRMSLDSSTSSSTSTLTTGNWYLVAFTKPTGNNAGRFHIYTYSTGAWVHQNGSTSMGNSSTPVVVPRIGSLNGANFFDGDIAVGGAWNVVLTDTQIESLVGSLMPWFQIQPRGLWILDQGAVTMNVNDHSGGGANQTARTGTAVSTGSVPIWTPGAGAMAA